MTTKTENRPSMGRRRAKMATKKATPRPVMITTARRGVFFGYMEGAVPEPGQPATITNARNCVYWSSDLHGFLGLAAAGPGERCRIGPPVPELTVYEVTSITQTTAEAAKAWEAAPWGR